MGIAERRQREKKLREEQIREAAIKVFHKKGFNGATIEDIANEAELSVGTIYLYFKNKEELYASLNHRTIELLDHALDKILDDGKSSPEKKTGTSLGSSFLYLLPVAYLRSSFDPRAASRIFTEHFTRASFRPQ